MTWFYMQAGAMPLLIAALAALYLRPGKRRPISVVCPHWARAVCPVTVPDSRFVTYTTATKMCIRDRYS